jgi:5-formyltetrahydrofolate cyclo-ligase
MMVRTSDGTTEPAEELTFTSKADARQWVWDTLQERALARFPFPPHGRIPNFAGAEAAAQRLFRHEPWASAQAIKVNPDSPQRHVRRLALARGIRVYVPTPRLAGGFHLLDPEIIPPELFGEAAALSTMTRHSTTVALEDIEPLEAIVTGCAAVTMRGGRCGKGEGYSDIEFAILRELGHPPVPVATTVHDVQVVGDFPLASNDLPLSLICTPTRDILVADPPPAPEAIEWDKLSPADIEAMPVLAELRRLKSGSRNP